jgi:RNA-binding protein
MSMTGKERAALRSEAHHLDVLVHIGHAGLTPTLLTSLDDVLRTKELVKVQVAKAGELSAKDAANETAEQMGAEVVQVIGRTFTLYRENPELKKKGDLPPWRR